MEPVDVRTVLKLLVEPTERPELYDFLFGSGVVREDEGVEILRGSIDGERDEARTSVAKGNALVPDGVCWPWFWCIDNRFIRRVSVGLMVLAPRPVACDACETPGMMDMRFPEDELPPFPGGRGDRGAIDTWLWSTDRVLVSGESID